MAFERLAGKGTCSYNAFADASQRGLLSPEAEEYVQSWPNGRPIGLTAVEVSRNTGTYSHLGCRIEEIGDRPVIGIFREVFYFEEGKQVYHADFLDGEFWLKAYLETRPLSVLSGVILFEPIPCTNPINPSVDHNEIPQLQVASMSKTYGAAKSG